MLLRVLLRPPAYAVSTIVRTRGASPTHRRLDTTLGRLLNNRMYKLLTRKLKWPLLPLIHRPGLSTALPCCKCICRQSVHLCALASVYPDCTCRACQQHEERWLWRSRRAQRLTAALRTQEAGRPFSLIHGRRPSSAAAAALRLRRATRCRTAPCVAAAGGASGTYESLPVTLSRGGFKRCPVQPITRAAA